MLRFNRNSEHVPNYSARGVQLRLLVLVFSLGLVILIMGEVRKPQRWTWLWGLDERPAAADPDAGAAPARTSEPPTPNADRAGRTQAAASIRVEKGGRAATAAPHGGYFPGVDPRRLEPIEDHSLFRRRERDAWFHLIDVLLEQTPEQLRQASEGRVGFAQLYHQPEYYRGRLVTLEGEVRRTEFVGAPKNPSGVDGYYRLTMQPAGGPRRPVVVFTLTIPKGFPQGNDVRHSVAVTGFFFKNCAYSTQDDVSSYPTVLAKSVETNGRSSKSPSAVAAETGAESSELSEAKDVGDASMARFDDGPATPGHAGKEDKGSGLGSLLELVGVGPEERRRMAQHEWLDDDALPHVLETLYHLRRFEEHNLRRWAIDSLEPEDIARRSGTLPVRLYAIEGRLRAVRSHAVADAVAARLQLPAVHACRITLGASSWPAEVLVADMPRKLQREGLLNEQVAATGLLIRVAPAAKQRPRLVFAADRLKWHPDHVDRALGVSYGMTVLGALGMDVGLWDTVRDRRPLEAGDRACFFHLLDAVQRAGAGRLERAFRRRLPERVRRWEQEAARLEARLGRQETAASKQTASSTETFQSPRQRLTVLRQQIARAEQGLASVVPLFNQPRESRGSLVVLEGTARRAVRIYSDPSLPLSSSEQQIPSAVNAYYELDVFTDDSQNNPVVFCVRKLPAGFPEGDQIQERIRAAGFMFKAWAFPADARTGPAAGSEDPSRRWRIAPLVVAPAATWIRPERVARSPAWQWWGGGLFVLALAAAWVGLALYRRGDRRFQREVLERHLQPPEYPALADDALPESDSDATNEPRNPTESERTGRQ